MNDFVYLYLQLKIEPLYFVSTLRKKACPPHLLRKLFFVGQSSGSSAIVSLAVYGLRSDKMKITTITEIARIHSITIDHSSTDSVFPPLSSQKRYEHQMPVVPLKSSSSLPGDLRYKFRSTFYPSFQLSYSSSFPRHISVSRCRLGVIQIFGWYVQRNFISKCLEFSRFWTDA